MVEPHKLKPTAALHAFKDIILLSVFHHVPNELRRNTHLVFTHGLKAMPARRSTLQHADVVFCGGG